MSAIEDARAIYQRHILTPPDLMDNPILGYQLLLTNAYERFLTGFPILDEIPTNETPAYRIQMVGKHDSHTIPLLLTDCVKVRLWDYREDRKKSGNTDPQNETNPHPLEVRLQTIEDQITEITAEFMNNPFRLEQKKVEEKIGITLSFSENTISLKSDTEKRKRLSKLSEKRDAIKPALAYQQRHPESSDVLPQDTNPRQSHIITQIEDITKRLLKLYISSSEREELEYKYIHTVLSLETSVHKIAARNFFRASGLILLTHNCIQKDAKIELIAKQLIYESDPYNDKKTLDDIIVQIQQKLHERQENLRNALDSTYTERGWVETEIKS